jgi:cellulose synthase/poly-beta-1,6-N-acetylglucosamine synthase-like glycosyltransferase
MAERQRFGGGPDSLEKVLLARGSITAADLSSARKAQRGLNMPVTEILLLRGALSEVDLISAHAEHSQIGVTDLTGQPPDPDLADLISASDSIALQSVPWRRIGAALVIVTAQPHKADDLRALIPANMRVILTLAPHAQILDAQTALYGDALARQAEGRARARESCRSWRPEAAARTLLLCALILVMFAVALPVAATALVFGTAFAIFFANIMLKTAAFACTLRADRHPPATGPEPTDTAPPAHLHDPVVTVLVPLLRERDIAATLITNLSKLDYPRERLDVLLAVEADDMMTRDALARCKLPPWMRAIVVPPGHPRTKPRALNFALNFARGSIVGIYDAEDRPDPDQIRRVVDRFAHLAPEVACLQGRLDYYNSNYNGMARCFAIEYANWFRVLLPGVQRLGLFVPLGGTTLFLRRDVLEAVGAWDAHNVTEDADLGLRLASHGYRTEIIDTTTFEEANAAILPWISQRSRWQKGYLMTWATAMRHPLRLWRGLGTWRFFGMQVQVLFAVAGFLVAPLLWTLIVKPFGVAHPLDALLTPFQYGMLAVAMVASLVLSMALAIYATRAPHLRANRPWILVAEFYYVLGTVAAWRAVAEMLVRPFFWAKTEHGKFSDQGDARVPFPRRSLAR